MTAEPRGAERDLICQLCGEPIAEDHARHEWEGATEILAAHQSCHDRVMADADVMLVNDPAPQPSKEPTP